MPPSTDDVAWVDVLPSMQRFVPELRKALGGSMAAAGKQAGADFSQAMQKQAVAGVEAASDKLAAARNKEADAAGRLTVAEKRLQELRDSGKAKASQLAAAQEAVAKAQRAVADTMSGTERAARQLADAQQRAADSAEDLGKSHSRMSGFAEGTKKVLAGVVASAAAAGTAVAAGFWGNIAAEQGNDRLAAQLGLNPQEAAAAGRVAGALYRDAYGESLGQVNTAVDAVMSSIDGMRTASEADLRSVTATALDFASAFEADVSGAAALAGNLIRNGLAKDSTEAFDLMTAAYQQVPAAMREELPDILTEYGTNFRALGFTGEEAFGLLVGAAQQGQFALDKTGDALKEFSIRATDMSKTSVDAYDKIGLNAQEMANAILAGGDTAQEATTRIAQGILSIEDPAERANTAIALFGTPLEDLSVDQIPQFLQAISGAGGAMEGAAGAAGRMGQTLNDNFATRVEGWKRQAAGFAQEGLLSIANGFTSGETASSGWQGALERVGAVSRGVFDFLRTTAVPTLQNVATWVGNNQPIVYGLVGALGALVLVTQAHAAAMAVASAGGLLQWIANTKIASAVTKAWTAVQWLLNAALSANPLVLVGIALAALVAGLVLAYQKSETFRNIVQGAFAAVADAGRWMWENVLRPTWEALKAGWDAIADGISWAWNNIIKPVWDFIATAAQALFIATAVAVFGPMLLAWKVLSEGVKWAWENVLRPAWDAVAAGAQWLWASVLSPVFGFIRAGWDALLAGIGWAWTNVLRPTWDAVSAAASWLWTTILRPIWDAMRFAWDSLLNGFRNAWENILRPTWEALRSAAEWLWNTILRPIFSAIGGAWDAMGRGFRAVYDNVIRPLFDTFSSVVNTVRDGFGTAVDTMGRLWDGLKDALREPVQWVIDVVWNDGLRRLWNTINNLWGGDDLPAFRFAGGGIIGSAGRSASTQANARRLGLATGGIMPGYTPGRDVHSFFSPTAGRLELSGGEAVMRPEWTRVVGPATIDYWNQLARQEGEAGLRRALAGGAPSRAEIGHYASGGIITLPGWLDTALNWVPGMGGVSNLIDRINNGGGFGGGLFGDGLIGLVKSIGGKLWAAAKSLFDGPVMGGKMLDRPAGSGAVGGSWQSIWQFVKARIPQARINSTYRPGDPGYHGRGKAIDFGFGTGPGGAGSAGLAAINRLLHDALGRNLAELIYTGIGDDRSDLKNGRPHRYSAFVNRTHTNHVHAAAYRLGGIITSLFGGRRPSAFHNGGVVPDRGLPEVPAWLLPDERVQTPPQDRYTHRLVTATLAAERTATGPAPMTGELYLDSGELLGLFRGQMDQRDQQQMITARSHQRSY